MLEFWPHTKQSSNAMTNKPKHHGINASSARYASSSNGATNVAAAFTTCNNPQKLLVNHRWRGYIYLMNCLLISMSWLLIWIRLWKEPVGNRLRERAERTCFPLGNTKKWDEARFHTTWGAPGISEKQASSLFPVWIKDHWQRAKFFKPT